MFSFKPSVLNVDGKPVLLRPEDSNLVESARRAKVNIPAPCLKNQRKQGCCKACLVEVDGTEAFACSTKPKSNMNVVVRRKDLDEVRKQSIKNFKAKIKAGTATPCQCR
ncbi:(2Fe-2S)-binding protein [Vibrio sp. SCSIO 43135]|uniref:2Fe-2S iron-sulfur cluster-binding protein n=1 Tax=Vibrio sp. SCSIO 43135 TaxID=2819096 RepID=UPI00207620C6|nr:2Fe-2S iron-sulfur cluster-binding protein [Vibrio sp. SCSIO 43135]USD42781.1 (2Fe-2S)-binding protein [Vibrio sp. SCSIO 43135]